MEDWEVVGGVNRDMMRSNNNSTTTRVTWWKTVWTNSAWNQHLHNCAGACFDNHCLDLMGMFDRHDGSLHCEVLNK